MHALLIGIATVGSIVGIVGILYGWVLHHRATSRPPSDFDPNP